MTLLSLDGADHADLMFFQDEVWTEIIQFFQEKLFQEVWEIRPPIYCIRNSFGILLYNKRPWVFQDKRNLLDLYNAINGTNHQDPEELEITTLHMLLTEFDEKNLPSPCERKAMNPDTQRAWVWIWKCPKNHRYFIITQVMMNRIVVHTILPVLM